MSAINALSYIEPMSKRQRWFNQGYDDCVNQQQAVRYDWRGEIVWNGRPHIEPRYFDADDAAGLVQAYVAGWDMAKAESQ